MQVITPINTPNVTSNFVPVGDQWENFALPIKESVAYAPGTLMAYEVSASSPTGKLIAAATTNANGQNIVGILMERVAATDADYATAFKTKIVAVPKNSYARAEFTVGSGTFTAADVGRVCQTAGSGTSVAVDTNGAGVIIRGYLSATRGICSLDVPAATTA